ncbi:MAG: aminomethyl-transferring glycine dehydrogenase subunit GcvPB [Deltaproteobacteria bacterium]|nr:aminomethyl-transferring glycine dehydrogenase subunit GcvPB [Deltaproteobacteria bacterium]
MAEPLGTTGLIFNEPLLFEQGAPGRRGYSLPACDVEAPPLDQLLPSHLVRKEIEDFPEVSEVEVVRHFTRMSQWNFAIDVGPYPLGSCTMKYNPKVNEEAARIPGFALAHPGQPDALSQGALRLMHELERFLADISGMDAVTLQPAAGAHGELAGMLMIRAYHIASDSVRTKVLVPDTAHGTNPASAALCGYKVVPIPTGERGYLRAERVASLVDDEVAAIMVTNPNTLGLFEEEIGEIAQVVHARGGLVYCDGANLNALLGIARPRSMGIDVLHFNLHKTFSTPHGGGGPGAGPVGVTRALAAFLPVPVIVKEGERFRQDYDRPRSIGRLRAFCGNFGMLVRAYSYILAYGPAGLREVAETAVLNANYLKERLKPYYHLPYDRPCMHECVFTDRRQGQHGVHTLDIAKRLMDFGIHPPTIYFPLVVQAALMIEPTETESREELDRIVEAFIRIAREAEVEPATVLEAPHHPKLSRLDEVRAARQPRLRWRRG